MFSQPVQCTAYLDNQITARPEHAHVTYLDMTKAIIELHGAHAVLMCDDTLYSAYVLEDK
jgi:hypothetical protein